MSVLVVLSGKALDVIFARSDRALLRSLILVGKQMCFQVLDVSTTRRDGADALGLFGVQRRLTAVGVLRVMGVVGVSR